MTHLIEPGHLTWPQLIAKMTVNPARVLAIDRGTLKPGATADVTMIDPNAEWTIDAKQFQSKSRNCPFDGWKVKGRAETVIVGGEVKKPAQSPVAEDIESAMMVSVRQVRRAADAWR